MYAIIRTGGKQAKVREGDVLDVERVKGDEITFTPLLLVDGKGKVTSDRDKLSKAKVTAKVLGPSSGPKIDVFKHKAKTGYRRSQGHRQKYTRIEVTKIQASRPPAKPEAKPAAKDPASKKPAAQKPAAQKPAAKKPAAQKAKKEA